MRDEQSTKVGPLDRGATEDCVAGWKTATSPNIAGLRMSDESSEFGEELDNKDRAPKIEDLFLW